jgi:UDP-N-acetylglucosamine 3-dehydrogenase
MNKSTTKKYNCAVIGVGNIGKHHARNYFEIKSANLVAVCDIDTNKGRRVSSEYKCNFYKKYKDMLNNEKIDIVSIATPVGTHYRIARDCINSKLNILLEKPITLTVTQCNKIRNLLQKNPVKFAVGHIERFNPAVTKLKEMITKGHLGDVKALFFQRVGPVPGNDKSVNVAFDVGIHDIELANYFLDTIPVKFCAFGGRAIIKYQEDYSDVLLNYGAANVHLQTNWITPVKVRKLTVMGTKGYAELNFLSQSLDFFRNNYARHCKNYGDFVIKFGGVPKKKSIAVSKTEPLRSEIESLIMDVKYNRTPKVSINEALAALKTALKVSHLIHKSQ